MSGVWHSLLVLGLGRDLMATTIGLAGVQAGAYLPWKRHRERQDRLIDLLDTTTPGGLSDVVLAEKDGKLALALGD